MKWLLAFVATAAIGVAALRAPAPAVKPVARRAASELSDGDRELLLTKLREGDLRAAKGDLDGARRAWVEVRRKGEGIWPIHEGLGDSYARIGQLEDAVREYLVAEPLIEPRFAVFRAAVAAKRASTLADLGRPVDAVRAYLDGGRGLAHAARILEMGRRAGGDVVARVIEAHAETVDSRYHALCAAEFDRLQRPADAAEARARYSISVAPWDASMRTRAISGLKAAGRVDRALEVCRAWAKSAPDDVDPYAVMGDLLCEAGREAEALVAYSSIVDVKPGDARSHVLLGDRYRTRGRLDDALGQYEAAVKARPDDAEAKARIAEVWVERLPRLEGAARTEARRKLALAHHPEGLYDLKIVMTWDAASDVDLDVIEPSGERVNHGRPGSSQGARYHVDNTQGYGPEMYTLATAAPGRYRVGVHLHGSVRSTARIEGILFEGTEREQRRVESVVVDKGAADPVFIADVVVP